MPVSGRKPLDYYSSGMDESMNSSNSASHSRGSPSSPRSTRQRSTSPKKASPSSLYPDLSKVTQEYDPFYPKHIENLYPHIDSESFDPQIPFSSQFRSSPGRSRLGEGDVVNDEQEDIFEGSTLESTEGRPVPAPRRGRKPASFNKEVMSEADSVVPVGEPVLDNTPLLLTIVAAMILAVAVYFSKEQINTWWNWYSTPADAERLALFQQGFDNFTRDYHGDIHPDSLRVLQRALEHHVHIASDSKHQYPTCILLTGDHASSRSLNCLADRLAATMPIEYGSKGVHVVDLSDESHHHKTPDTEDRRSRVHTEISEGLKDGSRIVVFRNLEALIPHDIPLLQLFYSYCDGDNPTFPKTLWIITVGTQNVTYLEDAKVVPKEPDFVKKLGRKVEQYLETILDSSENIDGTKVERKKPQTAGGNPLLTRIANHIVPVLRMREPTGQCGKGKTAAAP